MELNNNIRKKRLQFHALVIFIASAIVSLISPEFVPRGAAIFFGGVSVIFGTVSLLKRMGILSRAKKASDGDFWASGKRFEYPQGWHVVWVYLSTIAFLPVVIHSKTVGVPFVSPEWWLTYWLMTPVFIASWLWLLLVAFRLQFRDTGLIKLTIPDILRGAKLANKIRKESSAEINRLNNVVVENNLAELKLSDEINNLNARVDELKRDVQYQTDKVKDLEKQPKPRRTPKAFRVDSAEKA